MNNRGKANRAVVETLINNITAFNEIVRTELNTMKTSAEQLESSWNDPQYNAFNNAVQELNTALLKDLDILEEAKIELVKKLKIYD